MRFAKLLLLMGCLLPMGLSGQVDWELSLDSVTVKASRMMIPANRMGKYVTIIDQKQIRALPANSVDELLRWIPGVEMQMRGPAGAQSDISVRGSTFNQVLILLDGVRVNDPLTGHFSTYIPVPVSAIKRIEVLRGPAAAQFGSDAVGAVINIVTFDDEIQSGIDLSANGMLAENEWVSWDITAGLAGDNWRLELGGQTIDTDGHVIDSAGQRSDVFSRQFTLSGQWQPAEKWSLGVRGAWDKRDFAAKYFYTRSPFDESRENVSRVFSVIEAQYRPNPNQHVYFRTGYQVTTDSFLFNPAFTGNFHTTDHWDIQSGLQWDFSTRWTFHAGVQGIFSSITSNDRGDRWHYRAGGFLLANWKPEERLNFHGGFRLEQDRIFGLAWNPQLAIHYQPLDWVGFRVFAGKGIRAADFTERFVSTRLPGVLSPGRNVGNPDLEAEKSWSFELGTDIRWPENILHRVTVFSRSSSDLIDYVLTSGSEITNVNNVDPAADYFYSQNIASLHNYGLEYLLEFTQSWKEDRWLKMSTGLTLVQIGGDTETPSKYIANNSRVLWQNALSLQWRKSNLTIQHMYRLRDGDAAAAIDAELTESYHLVNLRMTYRPFGFIPFSVLVQIDNLLDENYSDILGAQMPGRWVKGGLSIRF